MRIIDADELINQIEQHCIDDEVTCKDDVIEIIDNAPTVELCKHERPTGEWIPINEKIIETLQDRYYYLVAHKDYTTPLKAKFYKDLPPYFKVCTFNGNFVTFIFEEENNEITHVMKLPEIPKEEEGKE